MGKRIISETDLRDLISENKYRVDPKTKFMSRCIDGRYFNKIQNPNDKTQKDLPAQAYPGADLGELATVLATARSYGLEIDREKAFAALTEVLGGVKNFSFHTDSHGDPKKPASGCGHFTQINLDPASYKLEKEDIEFINEKLVSAKKKGAEEIVLHGSHMEGAILIVSGNWGVLPRYELKTIDGNKEVEVFVFHRTLTNEKHRALVSALIKNKAVVFEHGEDEEYLYQALSETSDTHLLETARRLAPDLPIYDVEFDTDGSFKTKRL